jgi:putative ABC transport system ATP-binding protein
MTPSKKSAGDVLISCRGIRKSYGEGEAKFEALRGIDLDVHAGELTLLVGPSGSGKTTLLSIISMILSFDEGELFLLDRDVSKMVETEKSKFRCCELSIVFQSLFLIPTLTVVENVTLPLIVGGKDEESSSLKAIQILKELHIERYSETSPRYLSKGQQQRVAIARAIINDAKIIICDEPTSALDHKTAYEVMDILHSLASKKGKAVLVVTHDNKIFPYADRIINMIDGQVENIE